MAGHFEILLGSEVLYIGVIWVIMEKKMETLGPCKGIILEYYWGYMGIMQKMETARLVGVLYWGCMGIMEKKMETARIVGVIYWGCMGIMEKKMETARIVGVIYWGCMGIMEKKMETTRIVGVLYWGCMGIMEKKMETTIIVSWVLWGYNMGTPTYCFLTQKPEQLRLGILPWRGHTTTAFRMRRPRGGVGASSQ